MPDYTANHVEIVVGLRVFTNNLDLGTVVALNDDGWHDVRVDGRPGLPDRFNGERLTTRNPFTGETAK
jgi:hypothetical protein